MCTVVAEFVQSDFCFLIPDILDSSACIATGGRLILAGDSVSESEAVGIRFLMISWAVRPMRRGLPGYTAFPLEDIGDIRHSRVTSSR